MAGSVLLVHDDIATIAAARRALSAEGLEVSLATSAADAIITFGQRPPALIVLAPGVDGQRGHSVYDEIRSLPHGEHVRFLLLGGPIADAHDTLVVELPLQADAFRAAVRRALAVEGAGWELQETRATVDEPAPTPPEADPWRVADARTTVGGEPLADELFGDLKAEGEDSRPGTAGVPLSVPEPQRPPEIPESRERMDTDPGPSEVPRELADLPLEDSVVDRGHTDFDDQPTLDRAFEELELPAEELEKAAAERSAEVAQARAKADAASSARAEAQARRDGLRQQLEQARAQRQSAESDAERAEERRAALHAEAEELQQKLDAEAALHKESAGQLESASGELERLERGLANLAGMLAAEKQAREAAERALANTKTRHEALSAKHSDAEAQLAAETAQRQELEKLRDDAEQRARSEQEKGEAVTEAARAHAEKIHELEEALRVAEFEASEKAKARAGAEQELATLENVIRDLEHAAQQAHARAEAESAQLEGLLARKAEVESDRAAKEKAAAAAEQEAKAMQAQRAQLQTAAQQAAQKLQVESERLSTLERAREAADIKLAQAVRAEEKARADLEALRARKADVQQAADTIRSQLAKAEQARDAAEQARDAAAREVEKLNRQLESLKLELSKSEQSAADAEQGWTERELAAEQLREELEALQQKKALAADQGQKAQSARDEASQELELKRAEVEAEKSALALLDADREKLTAEIQAARRAAAQADEELRALRDRRAQTERDAEHAKQSRAESLAALEKQRTELTAELDAIESASEQGERELATLETQQSELMSKLEQARAAREQAQTRANALAARREEFHKAVAAAEAELASSPKVELAPERTVTEPARPAEPRPTKRAFAGGRFRKPTAPTREGTALPEAATAEIQLAPAFAEGPVEPRPPSFGENGELSELGAAAFFARCWQERVSGRFDFALRDGARALFFEEGRLVAALSSVPYDRLDALAQREGLITKAHERVLRIEAPELAPRQLAVRMVELQLLKGTELYGLVRRHMEQVAYALFAEQRGAFTYSPEVAPQEHRVALPVPPLAFMLEGVRRKGDFDQLNAALGGPSALVRMREGAPELGELGLTARERRFVALIDGLRTIEELIFASGLEPPAAVKLLHGLSAARVVDVLPGEPPEASREPELQIDLARVAEKYDQARNGDYFEILGVNREATSYEVRAAFERLAREFHPARFAGLQDPALPGRLEEIGRMVAEAADVLADDHTRRAYALHLSQAS